MQIHLARHVNVPDQTKVARSAQAPELGPKILFFSGGSALSSLSRELIRYTYNSIHIITPFDSGGSSAVLRNAFDMPAIGDLRSRLMALADRTVRGYPEIRALFSYRLAHHKSQGRLECEIQEMIAGEHPLICSIPLPMRSIIRRYIRRFHSNMPRLFDLHGANIGNIVLTGGFLANDRDLESILFIFSKLVQVRGRVTTIVSDSLHLAARLADSSICIGQHTLTGKEVLPISSVITDLYLCRSLTDDHPVSCAISTQMARQIASADLICYPMGSFFTSLVANLLPQGVGRAIQRAPCPKIFIPSTGHDPEVYGQDLNGLTASLLEYLTRDAPEAISPQDVLNFILVDTCHGTYPGTIDPEYMHKKGIQILDTDLVSPPSPDLDPATLAALLISMA